MECPVLDSMGYGTSISRQPVLVELRVLAGRITGAGMREDTIDLERIVYDLAYRREVIEFLNGSASQAPAALPPEHPYDIAVTREAAIKFVETLGHQPALWSIVRHGGRANGGWRHLASFQRDEEQRAREFYRAMELSLREGGIAMIAPDGRCDAFSSGPLVRTRW